MENNILEKAKRIHLIGIGGTGMSGLAQLLLSMDKKISGSDNNPSIVLEKLKKKGIQIFCPQREENICKDIELIIHSHAILPDNPEYKQAIEYNIPAISYPEAVGCVMEKKKGIAIAGTHGKTTTSSLIVSVLKTAGCSPSFLIGGEIRNIGNSEAGKGDLLVVEACEYKRSFLNYRPEIGVVTAIEEDHLDYYRDIEEIKSAFRDFINNIKGLVIYCADDRNVLDVIKTVDKKIMVSYGLNRGKWKAKNIKFSKNTSEFECLFEGKKEALIKIGLSGIHNIKNALAVIACARYLNIPWEGIKEGLEKFNGVHRRCEILGKSGGITIIDDYGHHPTEIKCTLKCIRNMFPDNRLIVVFQPHQYSRTRFLLKEFAMSFSDADKVVVPDIYFVRDSIIEQKLVNARMLVEKIRKNGKEALYLPTFDEIVEYLYEIVKKGDIILTIGAGPVDKVAHSLLKKLRKKYGIKNVKKV
ncbi:MAG TPA: UDP-N-acetylmuramate--L-alanine ligase [bacterium]|nr:UDP-N-acetylmuramate--L-alanine ligase [bacterium]HPP29505.1 UDP-N-acetylmuramate--L-alanine ligase [bacterium]